MSEGADTEINMFEVIVEYDEQILQVTDDLEEILDEQLNNHPRTTNQNALVFAMSNVLESSIEDKNTAQGVARALHEFLISGNEDHRGELKNYDTTKRLVDWLGIIRSKFELQAVDVYFTEMQGENYWNQMISDPVIRSPHNVPGLNHRIQVGYEEEYKLSVSSRSNLQLIEELLQQQVRLSNMFGESATLRMEKDTIENISEHVSELEKKMNTDGVNTE